MNDDFIKFTSTICGDSLPTFQTYDDDKSRKLHTLSSIRHGVTEEILAHLKELNTKGAGISLMVNEGDGKGRSNRNVVRIRVAVLDLDGSSLEAVLAAGLTPHIVVESSPGRYHVYWLVSDCTLEQYKDLQKRIAKRFVGDEDVNDLCRAMRIPGTFHNKKKPFLSRIIEIHDDLPSYTVEKIVTGLVLPEWEEDLPVAKKPTATVAVNSSANIAKVVEALSYIDMRNLDYKVWRDVGFAVHHEFGVDGFNIFNEWSKLDIAGYNEKSTSSFWESIPGETTTPIKIGYIFKLAKDSGWAPIAKYVDEMNQQYFVAFDAGRTSVFCETIHPIFKVRALQSMSFSDFRNLFCNQYVEDTKGDKEKLKPLGHAWIDHGARRQYKGITMAPQRDVPGFFNLWQGFAVEPAQGSWQLFKDHILNVICSGDQKLYKYVLGWMAYLIQNPGLPGQVALVLKGGRGTGKGVFAIYMKDLVGQHGRQVSQSKHVTGEFNAHLEDCILLFADEAFFAGDRQAENVLKTLITEETLSIVQKGKDLKTVPNMLHIIMASNNDWVVPAGTDERRYCVLEVSDQRKQDEDYFRAIETEKKSGGLEAMLFDLLAYDLSDFRIRSVPQTNALLEQKLQSLDQITTWWYSRLEDGSLLTDYSYWGPVPTQLLYDDFIKSAIKSGGSYRPTDTTFGMKMTSLLPTKDFSKKKLKRTLPARGAEYVTDKRISHYLMPDLNTCRKHFEILIGDSIQWCELGDDEVSSPNPISLLLNVKERTKNSSPFIFDKVDQDAA